MRDSMIFYRSFFEAIKDLPKDIQADVYNAIFSYGLDFKDPELEGISLTIWKLIKPQLDANNKRYENGTKGGRPKNQNKTETKPKNNLTETKNEPNVNDNVNVNDNINNKFNFRSALIEYGFESDLVSEWLQVRKKKSMTNTQTAFNKFIKQVELNGNNINDILSKCVEKSWGGFESEWYKHEQPKKKSLDDQFYENVMKQINSLKK